MGAKRAGGACYKQACWAGGSALGSFHLQPSQRLLPKDLSGPGSAASQWEAALRQGGSISQSQESLLGRRGRRGGLWSLSGAER